MIKTRVLDAPELLRGLCVVGVATAGAALFALGADYMPSQVVASYNAGLVYGAILICGMFMVSFQRLRRAGDYGLMLMVGGFLGWELMSTVLRVGFWTGAALEQGSFTMHCTVSAMPHLSLDELWASVRHYDLANCWAKHDPYPAWALRFRDDLGLAFLPAPLAAALILRAVVKDSIGWLWWGLPATIAWVGVLFAR